MMIKANGIADGSYCNVFTVARRSKLLYFLLTLTITCGVLRYLIFRKTVRWETIDKICQSFIDLVKIEKNTFVSRLQCYQTQNEYYVFQQQLMSSLEKRELQFSNVIDRGEALIAQHHPATKTIETHLQVSLLHTCLMVGFFPD